MAWGDPGEVKFVRKLTAGNIFDGFICANDYTAAVLLHTLERLNIAVPGEMRVVGFDDVRYATLVRVPLTTIHQPCREIAAKAVDTMMRRIAQPDLPPSMALLKPHLVVRESCGDCAPLGVGGSVPWSCAMKSSCALLAPRQWLKTRALARRPFGVSRFPAIAGQVCGSVA